MKINKLIRQYNLGIGDHITVLFLWLLVDLGVLEG